MSDQGDGGHAVPAPSKKAALIEFLIVGGISAAVIFWIIPWQTHSGGTIGLSPRLLPTVCAGAIGLLAALRFVRVLLSGAIANDGESPPVWAAPSIMVATIMGIAAIRYAGWAAGGAALSLLIVLVLGERRPFRVIAVPIGVAALLYLIQQTGI